MKLIKQKILRSFLAVLIIVVVSFAGSLSFNIGTASAAKPPIPIGCPGTKIQGRATQTQLDVCNNIPIGCPGASRHGPPSPSLDLNSCPYVNEDTTTPSAPAECSSQVLDEKARCEVAQECTDGDISSSNCGITRYLILFINVLSGMVGIVVIAVLTIGGIQYSTSAGDPNAVAAARKRISNALLALVAFGMMYGFLQWIVPGGVL